MQVKGTGTTTTAASMAHRVEAEGLRLAAHQGAATKGRASARGCVNVNRPDRVTEAGTRPRRAGGWADWTTGSSR